MKMAPSRETDSADDDLRPEYDLSQLQGGVRGKYFRRKGTDRTPENDYEQTSASPSGEAAKSLNGQLSPREVEAFMARMETEMRPIWGRCVLPIWGGHPNGNSFVQCGTGTLLRVADVSFLVTASHVPGTAQQAGYDLYISDAPPKAKTIPLYGRLSGQGDEKFDVAIWELPPDIVAALPNRSFLTVHHADRANRRATKGLYAVYGYPGCWSESDLAESRANVTPITYMTGLFDGDIAGLSNYDPEFHILLAAGKVGNRCVDGIQRNMPDKWNGISGCSIWQVYYEGLSSKLWTPDDAVVVAVQTGVYRGGTIIKGTRWWVVEQVIRMNYPNLADALSIVTPFKRSVATT